MPHIFVHRLQSTHGMRCEDEWLADPCTQSSAHGWRVTHPAQIVEVSFQHFADDKALDRVRQHDGDGEEKPGHVRRDIVLREVVQDVSFTQVSKKMSEECRLVHKVEVANCSLRPHLRWQNQTRRIHPPQA